MIDNIIIIDDVVPKIKQDKLEKLLLGPDTFWAFNHDVTYTSLDLKTYKIPVTTPGISSLFKDTLQNFENNHFNEVKAIALEAAEKINFIITDIVRARSFTHFPLNKKFKKEHDHPHFDFPFDHLVCLYYVNDTDGDTFIFDKKRNDDIDLEDIQVVQQISPKKGRCVLFDGNTYHASSGPTIAVRCIVNFDII
jgi:hypothetical protein